MVYVLAGVVVLALIALVVGAWSGRVKMTNCCSIADPSKDLRMRAAFEDPNDND